MVWEACSYTLCCYALLGKLNAIEEIQNIFCTCMTVNHRQCAIWRVYIYFFQTEIVLHVYHTFGTCTVKFIA